MNVSDVRVDIIVLSRRFEDSARGDRNRRYPRCRLSLVAIVASRFPPLFYKREDFRREHAIGVHANTSERPIIGTSRKRETLEIFYLTRNCLRGAVTYDPTKEITNPTIAASNFNRSHVCFDVVCNLSFSCIEC